ncbi:surfactant protein Ba [Myripristis murdjan]|uniref:surfactant protein Ba n=1 Tax=Myripristis murdjan TaxID=586833 RepID=UPI0011764395|nr:prosaposin-like [Myripristis murdjan]
MRQLTMASLKLAVFFFLGLQSSAPTLVFNVEGLQKVPDALSATGDCCQDCTQIFQLLVDLFSNADFQRKVTDEIESLCEHLPGPKSVKMCRDEVEKMLPVAITLLTGAIKPRQVCKILRLCDSHFDDKQQKLLIRYVEDGLRAAAARQQVGPTSQCSFCIFLIKTLESLLPKERTESAVVELLEEVCVILPSSYRDECQAVIDRFGKTLLDALMRYVTPEAVCALIHLCKGQEAPLMEKAVQDPCSLRNYVCRDFRTALRCRTVAFCQRFDWKSPSYIAL